MQHLTSTHSSNTGKVSVLLVEDNPSDAVYIRSLLEEASQVELSFECVERLSDALVRLDRGDIEIVLLDLHLPDSVGLDTLAAVNLRAPLVPVVVLTGIDDDELGLLAIHHGAQDYIAKGALETRFLERALRYAIARKQVETTELQLAAAQQIQKRLFPLHGPRLVGFDIAAECHPAEVTSGDYYDYIQLPDGTFGIVLADVSGHGFGPALVMAETRAYLRVLSRTSADPGHIFTIANRVLSDDTDLNLYITALFLRIDPEGPFLTYVGAGHEAHLLRESGRLEKLSSNSFPLAVVADHAYCETPLIPLEKGDVLFAFTDGISDAKNDEGERFSLDRVTETIRAHVRESGRDICNAVYRAARNFENGRPRIDDQTILVIKVL